jgi:hypothetical protein
MPIVTVHLLAFAGAAELNPTRPRTAIPDVVVGIAGSSEVMVRALVATAANGTDACVCVLRV